jgi:hypothetical protein
MALVAGHGNGAGQPRVEVTRGDRLPVGMPRPDRAEGVPPTPPPPQAPAEPQTRSPDLPPGVVQGPGAPSAIITSAELFPAKGPGKHSPFTKGNKFAALGGSAKRDVPKLLGQMGIPEAAPFRAFKALALGFLKHHVNRLARDVGGGECGPAPSMMVKFAAFQAASAEYLYREAVKMLETPPDAGQSPDLSKLQELFQSSSKLQNSSRQNLLAAHELCAKEALSRRNKQPSPHSALEKAFGDGS